MRGKSNFAIAIMIGGVWLIASARHGLADQIVLQNGYALAGDIIAEDGQSVTVDLSDANRFIVQRILKARIKQVQSWGHRQGTPWP